MTTHKMVKKVTAPFATPYITGWGLIILMLVVIPAAVLLPLNVWGHFKTVAGVTLFSTMAIWFFGVSPLANAYAGLAGGIWGLINDELSAREGAEQGIRTLFRAITIASFVFAVEGMIAFFVSFEKNPDAYLGLLVLGVVGTLLGLVFKTKTKSGLWLVSALLIFFAIMMLLGGRLVIPAAENVTAGEMASTASTAVSSVTLTSGTTAGASSPTTCSEEPQLLVPGRAYHSTGCPIILHSGKTIRDTFFVVGYDKFGNKPEIRALAPRDTAYKAPYGVAGVRYVPRKELCIFMAPRYPDEPTPAEDAEYMRNLMVVEAGLTNAGDCPREL